MALTYTSRSDRDGYTRTNLGEDLLFELEAAPVDGIHRELSAHGAAGVSDLKLATVLRAA